jgi:hypothetical protein
MAAVMARSMPKIKIGNQFASITNISIDRPMQCLQALYGDKPVYAYGLSEMTFSGIAMYTPEVLRAVQKWMYGTLEFPRYTSEFMCLHCGSPQSIMYTHCKQCGAPRSFLLG